MNFRDIAKDYNDVFGFNVIPLQDKVPKLDWKKWQAIEMELYDIDSLGWNVKINGVGAISGINSLRCLDFDDVNDIEIVKSFAVELGFGENYVWIVKSGSGKGFHIWFYADDEENYLDGLGGEKSYYKFAPKNSKSCDHIELRWKNCQTVLPPSLHPSGNSYEFVNLEEEGLPIDEPKKVWIGKLLEAINKLCKIEGESIKEKVKSKSSKASEKEGNSKNLKEYERKLLRDAVDYIKGCIDNYDDWMKVGFALASIGENGRQYFIDISSGNEKYKDTEAEISKKFDSFVKDYRGDITLGTFFNIAEKYGWVKPRVHFWRVTDGKAKIIITDLIELLEQEGYGKYYVGQGHIYVRVNNNIVSEVSFVNIKDFVLEYLDNALSESWIKRLVKESIIKSAKTIFSDASFEFLSTLDLHFVKDEKEKAFFFYSNCFVEVSKNKIVPKDYVELPEQKGAKGVIWEKQKIKREYKQITSNSVYEKFLENVCNGNSKRLKALKSALGYLLHRFKNPTCCKAIIFIDEKLSENAFGRSGKGLAAKAISQLRNVNKLDGKNFDFNKSFVFQSVNLDTELLFFDDVKKNFNFERLFSIITEGLTVEKKNKNEFYISFEEAPKILITTNYSIQGSDDSSNDRQFVVEFTDYYNAKHKPADDFGKLFFTEWDREEFVRFDNFMLGCCQLYLREGLIEYEYVNLIKKKLIDETSAEFEEFIIDLGLGKEYNKKDLFNRFKTEYEDFEKMRQNTFTKWTKTYARLYSLDVHERKSGADRFLMLVKKGEKVPESVKGGQSEEQLGF